jgi:hypothetical protein
MRMVSFPFEMGGGLDPECLPPPPGRMRGKTSGNMDRHVPGRPPAGGIPVLHGGMIGIASRALKPPVALPPDVCARPLERSSCIGYPFHTP